MCATRIQKIARGRIGRKRATKNKVVCLTRELHYFQAEGLYKSQPNDTNALVNFVLFMHATQRRDSSELVKLYAKALTVAAESPILNLGYAVLLKYLGKKASKSDCVAIMLICCVISIFLHFPGKHMKIAKLYDPDLTQWNESEETFFHNAIKYRYGDTTAFHLVSCLNGAHFFSSIAIPKMQTLTLH